MKHRQLLTFGLLFLAGLTFGQDPKQLPEVLPPSPEATSFAKFSETPVSHYTGLPSISVPFYSINIDGMNVPIGLSYHARGAKVEEIASRTGLGWTLNAGGAVTRQVRGSSDELPGYGYLNLDTYSDFFTNESTRTSVYSNLLNYPQYDLLPDKFQVQAPGLSASFLMNQTTGEPMLKGFDDLQITYSMDNGRIGAFTVVNSKGYKYYFGKSYNNLRTARDQDDVTHAYSYTLAGNLTTNSDDTYLVYNSWKLMDIISPQGDIISFSYDDEQPIFYRRSYDELDRQASPDHVISYFSRVKSTQYQLSSIDAPNTHIEFISEPSERLDLNDGYALSSVKVYEGASNLIKSFDLSYQYSDCVDDNNQLAYLKTSETQADKRLMLSSVTEKGNDGSSKPPYIFDYNATPLPNRFSNSQDYWGYYNDANNGRFLTFFDYNSTPMDRSIDTIASLAGMLEKITYPTGGYTEFTYEHNRAKPDGEVENIHFGSINPSSESDESVSLSQIEHLDYYDGSLYRKPFTVGVDVSGSISSNISFGDETGCASTYFGAGCKFRVYIYEGRLKLTELFIGQDNISLSAGNYDIVVDPQGTHDPYNMNDSFFINLTWSEVSQASTDDIIFTSGKRIKNINTYDEDQNLISFKEYEYLRSNGENSGTILGLPGFYKISQTIAPDGSVILEHNGAGAGSPLSTAQSNTIGYGVVTEYFGDKNNNVGKTEYQFSLTKDSQGYMEYPYHIPNDNEWLRGLPLKVSYFKKNSNGSYTLLKDIINEYLYAGIVPQTSLGGTGLMLQDEEPHLHPIGTESSGPEYIISSTRYKFPLAIFYNAEEYWEASSGTGIMYKGYYMTGGTVDKVLSTETSYDGGTNLIKTTEYNFNYDNHYQTASIITSSSDQDPIIQEYIYTRDLTNPSSADSTLIKQNRVVPIEIRQYKDKDGDKIGDINELLSFTKHTYQDNGLLKAELEKVSIAKGDEVLEDFIKYHSYDTSGNPLEVSREEGAHIVYLWGYDDQFPIAKIENAMSSEVLAQLSGHSNLGDYNETDFLQLNALRTNLPNALVTTYEYEPLVGVTKITDPKGQLITYHYDSFNRLEYIKDQLGNIVEEYQYNYKN